jgi:hypothetical protein
VPHPEALALQTRSAQQIQLSSLICERSMHTLRNLSLVSNYLIQLRMCVAYRTAAQLNLKEVIEQRGLEWLVQYNSMGLALWSSRGLGWQSLEALERWNSREPEQEQQQMAKPG